MLNRLLLKGLLLFVAVAPSLLNCWGQAHPRMILTPDALAALRSRAAANDEGWLALRGKVGQPSQPCESLIQKAANSADGLPPVYSSRAPVTGSSAGGVTSGYQGASYYDALHNLALCSQVVRESDPAKAKIYARQAVKVMRAMSAPFATLTVTSSGFVRAAWYVDNAGPGGQAKVFINWPTPELADGTTVTVKGVLGCEAANGTRKVASPNANSLLLTNLDGSPVICEGPGTNYNHNFLSDGGYPIRFFVSSLALGYDWLYDELDEETRQQVYATCSHWIREFKLLFAKNGNNPYVTRTQSNYHAGYYTALGLAGIAMRGDYPEAEAHYQEWRNEIHLGRDQPFYARWLGAYGGFPEAFTYMQLSVSGIGVTLLANYTAFGDDLIRHPTQPFPWPLGVMKYFVHGTAPNLTNFNDRGAVPAPSGAGYDTQRITPGAFWLPYYLGKIYGDPFTPFFKSYIDDVMARYATLRGNPPIGTGQGGLWQRFLFFDKNDPGADWRQEPTSLATMANPAGGYGHILMRSAWNDNAVLASFQASPQTSDAYNGKERMDKGSLLIQRGTVPFLVNPAAEASRAGDTKAYNFFHNNSGDRSIPPGETLNYSLYYLTRPGWTEFQWPATSRLLLQSPGSDRVPPDAVDSVRLEITADPESDVLLATRHGLRAGAMIYFFTSGELPEGMKPGENYFVREPSEQGFRISAKPGPGDCGEECVDLKSGGSGTLSAWSSPEGRIVTNHPARVDAYEDRAGFVYSRGVGLEHLAAYDEQDPKHFPMASWQREVLYLRPQAFIVYDRTRKRDKPYGSQPLNYTQYLGWSFSRTPRVTTAPDEKMTRVIVSDDNTFKGAMTSVLPMGARVSVVDLGGYGLVHQARVSPAEDQEYTNWLTVLEAAESESGTSRIERLEATGGDVIELDGSIIVGFAASADTQTMSYTANGEQVPIHIIAGLAPSTAYQVDWNGRTMAVSLAGSGVAVTTSAAGVLYVRVGQDQGVAFGRAPAAQASKKQVRKRSN